MSFLVVLVEKWMVIPALPGGLIIYQGNPSMSPKRTPMFEGVFIGTSRKEFTSREAERLIAEI